MQPAIHPPSAPSPAKLVAEQLAMSLGERPSTIAVCLLGSVARGDATPSSDIDLLAITRDGRRPRVALSALEDPGASPISLMVRSAGHFARSVEGGTLFALHVRTEGQVLFERRSWLTELLARTADVPTDTGWTLDWAERELAPYQHLDRFNGIFLHALSRLYSVGRAVAIALTVRAGHPEFGKDRPFTTLIRRFPSHRAELERLVLLRAFHERASGAADVPLPFDHHGAADAVEQAVVDIGQLIRADGR